MSTFIDTAINRSPPRGVSPAMPAMRRVPSIRVMLFALALLLPSAIGCGDEDLTIPGSIPPTETVTPVETPSCLSAGDICETASDCCSGVCNTLDGETFTCG